MTVMIDMLVRLYDLPDVSELYAKMEDRDITLRRARAFEKHNVAEFAASFSEKWKSEVEVAITRQPAQMNPFASPPKSMSVRPVMSL